MRTYWVILVLLLLPRWAWAQTMKIDCSRDATAEIQIAFDLCFTVELPADGACVISAPLVATTCAGFEGNGARLLTAMPSGALLTVKSTAPGANYTGNQAPWRSVNLMGPGWQSATTVGLVVQASNWGIHGLSLSGFWEGWQLGANGYSDVFYDVQMWNNRFNVSCPSGLANAGENISFIGGAIFNSPYAFYGFGCEANFTDLSIDAIDDPIFNQGGVLRFSDVHFEKVGNGLTLFQQYGGNSFGHILVRDSDVLTDANESEPLIQNNGGYAQFEHVFLSGFASTAALVLGDAANQVSLCGITNGAGGGSMDNVANVGSCP